MKNINLSTIKWGDIYLCDFGITNKSVQSKIHPVLIIQNNIDNKNSPTVTVADITSALKKTHNQTHIVLDASCGLQEASKVMIEQIHTINKSEQLLDYVGKIEDKKTIYKIKQAIMTTFGLSEKSKFNHNNFVLCLCQTCRSEFMRVSDNIVHRIDPLQVKKERCDKCQMNYGYDYIILKKKHRKHSLGDVCNE